LESANAATMSARRTWPAGGTLGSQQLPGGSAVLPILAAAAAAQLCATSRPATVSNKSAGSMLDGQVKFRSAGQLNGQLVLSSPLSSLAADFGAIVVGPRVALEEVGA